jgi:hypothetical protein
MSSIGGSLVPGDEESVVDSQEKQMLRCAQDNRLKELFNNLYG